MKSNPIHELTHEHKYILKVVEYLKVFGERLNEKGTFDEKLLRNIIAFMREFADQCHHAKEESLLFPALVAAGVSDHGCPIDGLKNEHKQGRSLINQLEKGVDLFESDKSRSIPMIKTTILQIVELYPAHIWKEDEMVFPMAKRVLSDEQLKQLQESFDELEEGKDDQHRLFEQFVQELDEG